MPQQIKIFSWNVNGLRSVLKKGALQAFVSKYEPDILCLQEIRTHEEDAERDFPNYREFWCSAERKGYGGTAIFSKIAPKRVFNHILPEIAERYALSSDSAGNPNDEGRVISAEFDDFWLVNVYTPNSKPDLSRLKMRKEQWDPAFLAHCKELEKSKLVVVCGDLNVAHTEADLAQPEKNRGKHGFTDEEREGLSKFLDTGFVDTYRVFEKGSGHYTWWSNFSNARARNLGWRIDYILVSAALKDSVTGAAIHAEVMGSDHCPISLKLISSGA